MLNALIFSASLGRCSHLGLSGAPVLLVQQHLGVSGEPVSESLPEHLRCGRVCVLLAPCFFCFCRGCSFTQPAFGGIYQRPAVLGTGTHSVVLVPGGLAELQSRDLGGEGRGSRGGRRRSSWGGLGEGGPGRGAASAGGLSRGWSAPTDLAMPEPFNVCHDWRMVVLFASDG